MFWPLVQLGIRVRRRLLVLGAAPPSDIDMMPTQPKMLHESSFRDEGKALNQNSEAFHSAESAPASVMQLRQKADRRMLALTCPDN
ncbi:hypothetical protein CEXT_571651 [Caerostris extrusa]|uniref:Uncharacterized protein n=1 Tax=Caerostris extrusa TaxID=172846 RepID=A0AAV4PKM6_CAEEX|nr:hypothetical protein CEXT_571651 [Caerostris extrusa]